MKIVKIRFDKGNEKEALDKIRENKPLLYSKCLEAIEFGFNNDILNIKIFEIELSNGEVFDVHCHRNEWDSMLEECLEYYISTEEYEKCLKIKNLLEL